MEERTPLDDLIENPDEYIAFESEVMLSHWKDTPEGMYVTFLIHPDFVDDPFPAHPFKKHRAKGLSPERGTRFWMRAVELGDDDEPINQEMRSRVRRALDQREGNGARLSREAAILCRTPLFQAFVRDEISQASAQDRKEYLQIMPHGLAVSLKELGRSAFDEPGLAAELCKFWMYASLGIKSRKQLDSYPQKVLTYQAKIIEPYYMFREKLRDAEAKERAGVFEEQPNRQEGDS